VPVRAEDPILDLGKQPVVLEVEDASLNHDRYLYGCSRQTSHPACRCSRSEHACFQALRSSVS
jgi:hypothetical protein